MTEEIRPICLYVETCLDRKEGTRDCAKCEHHLNYWTEVMIRDMGKNIKRLEQELKWANDEEKYLKDCCIKAGKELEKHSFKWDGKEKNLVVQALQLNQLYEKLKQKNKELKKQLSSTKCYLCGEGFLTPEGAELYEEKNNYRSALEEIKNILKEICKEECDYTKPNFCGDCDCRYGQILNKINEVIGEK